MKYHIITYGCQMNKSDSERIAGTFNGCGWQEAKTLSEADLVILNSCSVRQSAEDRIFGEVDELGKLKKKNPDLIIAVTGCMPGRDKAGKYKKKMPSVDLYFPINDLPRLPEMLSKIIKPQDTSYPAPEQVRCGAGKPQDNIGDNYLDAKPSYQNNFSAFIPIQNGCNKFCAYCVVPYARGKEVSRPLRAILDELRYLAGKGFVEVTFLGQTVNGYAAPDSKNFSSKNPFKNHFAALLWEANQIEGIERVNFTASHPDYMDDETVAALGLPKQVNYLHLPAQSGSDKVLAKMNRHYTAGQYLDIIKKIRLLKPGIALGTDIIVGFPGETGEDFEKTVELYKKADFDIAFLAKYSPRSGTAAHKLNDDVPPEEKERRWWILQRLMEETTLRKNQKFINKTVDVLVHKVKKFTPPLLGKERLGEVDSLSTNQICVGNSSEMKMVEFAGQAGLIGKIVKVKIQKAETWRLIGKKI